MTFRPFPAKIHKRLFVLYKEATEIREEIVGIRQ